MVWLIGRLVENWKLAEIGSICCLTTYTVGRQFWTLLLTRRQALDAAIQRLTLARLGGEAVRAHSNCVIERFGDDRR
jgi:hypothetical protein